MKNPFSPKTPTIPANPHQITAENAYLYSPDAQPPRAGRFRRFWAGRTKAQQVLLIVGTVTIVFSSLMIGLSFTMMNSTGKKSAQNTVATSQTTNGTSSSATTSTTGEEDQGSTNSQNDTSASTEDVSWWQSLLSKVSGKTSSSSGSSGSSNSGDGSYSSDSVDTTVDDAEDWYDPSESEPEDDSMLAYQTPAPANNATGAIPYGSSKITIASWNTLLTNSKTNVGNGVAALAKSADILGVQELNFLDPRKSVREKLMCDTCTFTGYMYDWKSTGATPASASIFWNKTKFTQKDSGWLWSYGKAQKFWPVEKDSNAPDGKVASRYVVWVKLQDKATGREFYFINTHTIAAAEKDGRPNTDSPKRVALFEKHINVLASFIQSIKAKGDYPIFVTGDFNDNYRKDNPAYQASKGKTVYANFPYAKLTGIGMHSSWERLKLAGISNSTRTQGSSGNRIIDYVWSLDNSKLISNSASVSGSRYGSDHSPIFYTFGLK